jgi:hypothetical protein
MPVIQVHKSQIRGFVCKPCHLTVESVDKCREQVKHQAQLQILPTQKQYAVVVADKELVELLSSGKRRIQVT